MAHHAQLRASPRGGPPATAGTRCSCTGWIADIWGNRYQGGGTYRFWIANRMTMATATFQGMAYPVGTRYGRDIGFAPAVPADVKVTRRSTSTRTPTSRRDARGRARHRPRASTAPRRAPSSCRWTRRASTTPSILAKYTDQEGHLWVCSMRHAGVVYPADSPIVARGKKLTSAASTCERGETHFEGYVRERRQVGHLDHINYPFNAGDVLLIASEEQGANKIEPVLTYESKDNPEPYDTGLNSIGATNLQLKTSNGYSPHLFPEYITEWAYYYAGGAAPGLHVALPGGRRRRVAPLLADSPNSFGGQIDASNNGDMPGDIYRLIGGVVLRRPRRQPGLRRLPGERLHPARRLATTTASIAPGAEDLLGPTGEKARFFLVGMRPGHDVRDRRRPSRSPVADRPHPARQREVRAAISPDGRTLTSRARAMLPVRCGGRALDARQARRLPLPPGGRMGRPPRRHPRPAAPRAATSTWWSADKPKDAPEITFNLPVESTFTAGDAIHITGTSTAESLSYAAVIPGAVIDQGRLEVTNGKFDYYFDPKAISQRVPTYDVENRVTGRAELGEVVHLTFFSREKDASGQSFHSFARIIIRGNKVICTQIAVLIGTRRVRANSLAGLSSSTGGHGGGIQPCGGLPLRRRSRWAPPCAPSTGRQRRSGP